MTENLDSFETAVQDKISELLSHPDIGMHTSETIHSLARDLILFEKFSDGKLAPTTLSLVIATMAKMKRFFLEGNRHMGSAFHPEQELMDVRLVSQKQFVLATSFIEHFMRMRLTVRARNAMHTNCRCLPGTIGVMWHKDSSQFIYTYKERNEHDHQ